MTFLSWSTAALAGSIAIPSLLLLYFLKLRRVDHTISSTLLWKKAIQDLRVNAPFQKLRKNLLLFLQLLVLAAILFGLANPVANFMRKPEQNVVILIDRSGSMNTREVDGRTRLEHAKDAAVDLVSRLPGDSRAMVIGFGQRASVVSTFTDDKRRLTRLIRDIEPTDGKTEIGEALQLAVAYSSNLVEEKNVSVPSAAQQAKADIELFSDGRISDADRQQVVRGNLHYYRVGAETDNVGITVFDVRRQVDRPGMLSVFVTIQNFGAKPVKTDISLTLDGNPMPGPGSVREISLGPAPGAATSAPTNARNREADTSAQNVAFEFEHEAGGVVGVKVHRKDALDIDNEVMAPIDPPRPLKVLCVSGRDTVQSFLAKVLGKGMEITDLHYMTPAEYEKATDKELISEDRSAFDLVIIDQHDTNRLPPGNYVFFGGIPRIPGFTAGDTITGKSIVFGQRNHPLLRNLNYESLSVNGWRRLKLPSYAVPLLESDDSTVMAMITDPGHRFVVTAFDILESNWLITYAFPVFMQNAVNHLASGGLIDLHRLANPGDTLAIPVPVGAQRVRIAAPGGVLEEIDLAGKSLVTYAKTSRTGLYVARFDDARKTSLAFGINVLDEGESRIAPNSSLEIGSEKIASVTAQTKVNQPLWPHAAALALIFVLVEWWIYNRRVMI